MTESTKNWISIPKKGSSLPIVIEFDYEDWRRIERLSNRDDDWLIKVYDTIMYKASLPGLQSLKDIGVTVDVTGVSAGAKALKRIEKIGKKKYGDNSWPWINLSHGLSGHISEDDPQISKDQIILRPTAFGSHVWEQDVIDAIIT